MSVPNYEKEEDSIQQNHGRQKENNTMLGIEGLNHATFPISDVEKSRDFYGRILGLRELPRPVMAGAPQGAFFACGNGEIHLAEKDSAFMRELISININPHVAFTVASVAEVKESLQQEGVQFFEFSRNPAGRNQIFVQDPDGNVLEITDYRPGS
jgi:glyoxylase I family protein